MHSTLDAIIEKLPSPKSIMDVFGYVNNPESLRSGYDERQEITSRPKTGDRLLRLQSPEFQLVVVAPETGRTRRVDVVIPASPAEPVSRQKFIVIASFVLGRDPVSRGRICTLVPSDNFRRIGPVNKSYTPSEPPPRPI